MLSDVILGTLNFDYKSVSESFNQNKINLMLSLAHNLGVNTLDTAYYYGKTEQYLGQSGLMPLFKVNSKANPWFNNDYTSGKLGQLNRNGILQQLQHSKKCLGIHTFDTYFLHSWDYETEITETLSAFDECYRKEHFNTFGVSNISPTQLQQIQNICENNKLSLLPKVYQGMYNLYCRNIESLFPVLYDHNINFQCYNPLAGGLLTGKYSNIALNPIENGRFIDNPIYQSIFWNDNVIKHTEHLTTDISLRWLKYHSKLKHGDSIIIGCSSEQQLLSNISSFSSKPLSLTEQSIVNTFYSNSHQFQPNYFY